MEAPNDNEVFDKNFRTEDKRETMMIKLALVSALLLAMPFEAVAAKVKAKFVDQDKKAIMKSESKLVEKNSAKEVLRQGQQEG